VPNHTRSVRLSSRCQQKITAAFDGGRITSDGGVMVLAQAERRLAIAEKLAAVIADPRDPLRLVHRLPRTAVIAPGEHPLNADRRQGRYVLAGSA
jgi:hypothetical protein